MTTTIEDITPEYLTEALGQPVTALTSEPVGVGVGLIGQLYRVTPTYGDGGSGPEQLIVKLPGPTEEARFVAQVLQMYETEAGFYRDLAQGSSVASPGSHHITFDPETHDFVLILDDVGHCRQADQIEGLNLEDAKVAVRELARLNAAWWEHPDLLASAYLRPMTESPFPEAVTMSYEGSWPNALKRFGDLMSDDIKEYGARYGSLFRWFCEQLCDGAVTMSHGDWRGDNLFFTDDPENPLVAVDWQLITVAKGIKDFGYFVTQSLTPEIRAAHERELLQIWLDELAANGVAGYEFAEAWEDYRLTVAWAFVYPIIGANGLADNDVRGALLARTMLARSISAINDLNALETVTGP